MQTDLYDPFIYAAKEEAIEKKPFSFIQYTFQKMRENRFAFIALLTLTFITLFSIFYPLFSKYTYYGISVTEKNHLPSWTHFLGTDDLGRDILVRVCMGVRISLFIGITAAIIDLFIGVWYGMISAFLGKKVDAIMMRFCDVLDTIPYFLIVIALMVVLGPGLFTIIMAMCLTSWIPMARIIRSEILVTRSKEYVIAAKTLGAGFFRILYHHLLPSCISSMIVTLTLTISMAIFVEAILSFLGLGVQVPVASLGTLANEGLVALRYYPWRLFVPATMIVLLIFSFNQIADAIKEAFDPKNNYE